MSLSINCSRSHAIPRFASQPRSKMFDPDLQMTMSATDIVANKQVLRHNGVCSAGLVGHSSNQIALHIQYVGCSTGLLSAHTPYEPIIQDRVYRHPCVMPTCALFQPAAPIVAEGKLRIARQQHADNSPPAGSRQGSCHRFL
jgi:hypothetical protein